MVKVYLPDNFFNETKYITKVLLEEFLGVEYSVSKSTDQDFHFELPNNKRFLIKNHFFSKVSTDYYKEKSLIPTKITFLNNDFVCKKDLPVLFGGDSINTENDLIIDSDIYASAFFMLSRWEEYANKARDNHDRFPFEESLAWKQGFLNRPIVNEYAEFIWNILSSLDKSLTRKKREFEILLTHDIDFNLKWRNPLSFAKTFFADLIKRKSLSLAFNNLSLYTKVVFKKAKDPFDKFDIFLELAKKNKSKSIFFLMSGKSSKFDDGYSLESKNIKDVIPKIYSEGCQIGLHPSYYSSDNKDLYGIEINKLSQIIKREVKTVRQHFLRFKVPYTWSELNNLGVDVDSTMIYSAMPGFRTGTCRDYTVFDFLNSKELNIKEKALHIMDTTIIEKSLSDDYLMSIVDNVKCLNGELVLLLHNSYDYNEITVFKNIL